MTMLLDPRRSHLIVVDVQQRLLPAILDGRQVVSQIAVLLRGADRLEVPVTVTEQYPKGLGPTDADVLEAAPTGAIVLPKMSFSAARDAAIAARVHDMRAAGRDQLVLCGAEAHVCVLQSALGFRAAGFEVAVVADAVSSRAAASVSAACARLLHAGCHWVTVEMVIFEWLERAGTDDFRALSALIR
jgi:nicotinamidase-related amidase